jgi:hypothetical protein
MEDFVSIASTLIEEAVDWLREHYGEFDFWVERDLAWTVQTQLRRMVDERELPYLVLNDYPMLAGSRRALTADLVIRDRRTGTMVAVEFRYEPAQWRTEFMAMPGKLPVVVWGAEGVAKDVGRIRKFVEEGVASVGYALFVDEGRRFRHRQAHPGTRWVDWDAPESGGVGPSVLWSRWPESFE